jgi:hypothetical protein
VDGDVTQCEQPVEGMKEAPSLRMGGLLSGRQQAFGCEVVGVRVDQLERGQNGAFKDTARAGAPAACAGALVPYSFDVSQ